MTKKSLVERLQDKCKHFTGIQHDVCKVGVKYADVKDESVKPFRWPCLDKSCTTCPKVEYYTKEEAEAQEREFEQAYARISTALKAIHAKHGKARGLASTMPCPNNCGGTLHYSISGYNGHIHGKCTTKGCCSWMQ